MKTLFKNARILKMTDENIIIGHLLVKDDRIAYIGSELPEDKDIDEIIDCDGNLLMPGFKNAHTHSAMSFLRSKTDDHTLQDWLFNVVLPREALLQPGDVYELAKISFLEYLSGGITACFDMYYSPLESAKAAEEMGMRITLCGTYNKDFDMVKKLYRELNEKDGLVRYCLCVHAEYTLGEGELENIVDACHELHAPFFAHISETETEVKECIAKRGMTPVAYFEKMGAFDYGGGGYHCCWFTDEDIQIFKRHNCSVVTCPGSNTKLASGIAPICKYLENGINVAIGTDGPASNNSLDMFKEMTLTYALQKVTLRDPTALPAFELLKMATVNGAKAIGLKDCDTLEVGKKADIIEIDLKQPNMQPINNIINNIVYSGTKENVILTMINGKILYRDGKYLINEDISSIYEKCAKIGERIEKGLLDK
ncbi:MAG: amidohydrolase [Bacilli bacterium]|nr:amidohydrolase [Bacilli bacterium]